MKRILESVMPVGAPWGGPESSRFPMGKNHMCEPEKYAEAFRAREVREKVAVCIEAVAKNDRKMLMELRKYL